MATHQELLQKIADLQKQADLLKNSERKGVIDQVNGLIADFDIKPSELRFAGKAAKGGKKSVAVKYRDSAGNTWSGRGRTPTWLAAAESNGKRRESFLVTAG
jgi:DNA-binding protein H-NS